LIRSKLPLFPPRVAVVVVVETVDVLVEVVFVLAVEDRLFTKRSKVGE